MKTLRLSLRAGSAAGVLVLIAACSDAPTRSQADREILPPPPAFEVAPGIAAVLDVPYATRSAAQKLDIHLPTTGSKPYPVVVWVHGGGWQSGDKRLAASGIQLQLVSQGYAVVSVNYRLSAEAKYPAQIQDVKAAVRWIRANAATYQVDPNRVGAWGLSAGGHLVALLGTTVGVASLTDPSLGNSTQSEAVKTVVAMAAPVNLMSMDSQLAADGCPLFGGTGYAAASSPASLLIGAPITTAPSLVLAASPRSYVSAGDAKFLIQHGKLDCTVPYQQGQAMHNRLQVVLGAAASQLDLFPNGKHGGPDFTSPANFTRILNYLKATL